MINRLKIFIRNIILKYRTKSVKFIRKHILMDHKFKPTDIIKSRNGDQLFEVEETYYDRDLEPVYIVKKYGSSSGQVYSISYPTILDFIEYKGKAPGSNTVEI